MSSNLRKSFTKKKSKYLGMPMVRSYEEATATLRWAPSDLMEEKNLIAT